MFSYSFTGILREVYVVFNHFLREGTIMFNWAILFLVIALIAAWLGFGALAGTAAWAAKIVFIVGLIMFVVSLVMGRRA